MRAAQVHQARFAQSAVPIDQLGVAPVPLDQLGDGVSTAAVALATGNSKHVKFSVEVSEGEGAVAWHRG